MRPAFSRDPIVRLFQKWYLLIYLHKIQDKISTLKRFFQGSLRYSKTQFGFYQTSSPNVFFKGTNAKMTALTIFSFLVWFKFRLSQLCSSFKIARLISRGPHRVSTLHCAWNFIFQGDFSLALLGSRTMDAWCLDYKYFTAKIITQTQIDIPLDCLRSFFYRNNVW